MGITGATPIATYGLAVYQHVDCDTTGQGGRIGENDLVMGRGIILNPTVFRSRFTSNDLNLPAGRSWLTLSQ